MSTLLPHTVTYDLQQWSTWPFWMLIHTNFAFSHKTSVNQWSAPASSWRLAESRYSVIINSNSILSADLGFWDVICQLHEWFACHRLPIISNRGKLVSSTDFLDCVMTMGESFQGNQSQQIMFCSSRFPHSHKLQRKFAHKQVYRANTNVLRYTCKLSGFTNNIFRTALRLWVIHGGQSIARESCLRNLGLHRAVTLHMNKELQMVVDIYQIGKP